MSASTNRNNRTAAIMGRGNHCAARFTMQLKQFAEARERCEIERVRWLVKKPQWCAGRHDPSQRRALRLASRKQAHRDPRQGGEVDGR